MVGLVVVFVVVGVVVVGVVGCNTGAVVVDRGGGFATVVDVDVDVVLVLDVVEPWRRGRELRVKTSTSNSRGLDHIRR